MIFAGYILAILIGDLLQKCSYQLFHEYKNITLSSTKMRGIIWSLLPQKFSNICQIFYISCTLVALICSQEFRETISLHTDFWMVLIITYMILIVKGYLKSVSVIL